MIRFFMVVALVLGIASASQADHYFNTGGISVGTLASNTGDQNVTALVAGFDTTKGTLDKVCVTYSVNYQIAGAVDSWDYPWSATATSTSLMGVNYWSSETFSDSYNPSQYYSGLPAFTPYPFGAFNVTQGPLVPTTFYSGPVFANFAAGYDTTFSVDFNNTASGTADIFFCNWVSSVTFKVTYHYTPFSVCGSTNAVPEPASVFLMGLGSFGFLFLKKSKDV